METATSSIFDSMKNIAGGGNLDAILNIFQGGGDVSSHPAINNISGNVASDLMKKFGLDHGTASGIVQ